MRDYFRSCISASLAKAGHRRHFHGTVSSYRRSCFLLIFGSYSVDLPHLATTGQVLTLLEKVSDLLLAIYHSKP